MVALPTSGTNPLPFVSSPQFSTSAETEMKVNEPLDSVSMSRCNTSSPFPRSKRRFGTRSRDSKDAAVPGKCEVWFWFYLLLLTMQKLNEMTMGDSATCVQDCVPGG